MRGEPGYLGVLRVLRPRPRTCACHHGRARICVAPLARALDRCHRHQRQDHDDLAHQPYLERVRPFLGRGRQHRPGTDCCRRRPRSRLMVRCRAFELPAGNDEHVASAYRGAHEHHARPSGVARHARCLRRRQAQDLRQSGTRRSCCCVRGRCGRPSCAFCGALDGCCRLRAFA